VVGIEEAEHESDGQRLDPLRPERGDQRIDLEIRQRRDHGPVGADALGDLIAVPARNEGGGRILEQVVKIGPGGAPQLQHVAEPARGDEGGARAAALEDGVGDDRGGVRQQGDLRRRDRMAVHGDAQRRQHALGQVARRRRHLGDADLSRRLVDQRHVGERTADVDPNPPRHVALCPMPYAASLAGFCGSAPMRAACGQSCVPACAWIFSQATRALSSCGGRFFLSRITRRRTGGARLRTMDHSSSRSG
jgi:hypothetical protein